MTHRTPAAHLIRMVIAVVTASSAAAVSSAGPTATQAPSRAGQTSAGSKVGQTATEGRSSEVPSSPQSKLCSSWEMTEVGRLDTGIIDEASGLVASRTSERLFHVNDSGDDAYFYQTDRLGKGTKRIKVRGFKPYDVEDLGYGPCPGGRAAELCLAIADIGDNRKKRKQVRIVFVREVANFPDVVSAHSEVTLTYPTGPHDAEAFAVLPNGDLVIFTKELGKNGKVGPSKAFRAASGKVKNGAKIELEEFGSIDVSALTKSSGLGSLVTGMSVSSKGDRFLLLTYDRALEFGVDLATGRLPHSSELQAGRDYQMIDLLPLPQQEAIAYDKDDRAFFYDTESVKSFLGPFLAVAPLVRAVCRDRMPASFDSGGGSGSVSRIPMYFSRSSGGRQASQESGVQFKATSDARYVKFTMNFPRPMDLDRVSVESCGKSFVDGADFYFAPGERHAFAEGGTSSLSVGVPRGRYPLIRSMSAVMLRNPEPCVGSVRLFLRGGKEVSPVFPEFVPAVVSVGSKGERLFDSRPGTVSEIDDKGVVIVFEREQKFDAIEVWSGNQASLDLFRHSHHGKTLHLEGDDWSESLILRDAPSVQEFKLKKPFSGKQIKLRSDAKAVFAELRFSRNGRAVIPWDDEHFQASTQRKDVFNGKGFQKLLDGEFSTRDEKESWIFRFRSDGTFFIHGYGDDMKEARIFSALGDFEIESSAQNDGVHKIFLKLRGHRMALPVPWDGSWCGVACGSEEPSRQARPVNDLVLLERNERNDLMIIRNRSSRRERALPFEDHVLIPSSRHD